MTSDRRLIEDFIPIREISAQAAREKSIRKGHISTLHLWWARRPLVAARAAVFASLVAAPETYQKRTCLKKTMIDLCRWEAGEPTIKDARKKILEAQRERLNLPADTPLSEVPPPKVLDMFAGGGAIPLEALRLGCETYATELNPVAHIIELCTLVYPQKYGKNLAVEVEKWGNWVIENVRAEIGDLYPPIKVGVSPEQRRGEVLPEKFERTELLPSFVPLCLGGEKNTKTLRHKAEMLTPVAYLWTRTVKCPNPACEASVPLVRQTWPCKKTKKYVALKVIPNYQTKRVEFEVVEATTEEALGFDPAAGSSRGTSTCRHCGTTVKSNAVKEQGKAGRIGQQLMAIVCTNPGSQGKTYLSSDEYRHYVLDEAAIELRLAQLCQETGLTIPNEPIFSGDTRAFFTHLYGLDNFGKLFTPRQLLSLMTFVKWVRLAHEKMMQQGYEEEFGKAIATYLALTTDKVADYSSSLTRWGNDDEGVTNTYSRQALPMVWDFAETNTLADKTGAFEWALRFVKEVILNTTPDYLERKCNTLRGSATPLSLESNLLDAVISDRGSYADLGIQKPEKQHLNVKPLGVINLIDILHRLLWLSENKPQDIPNFLVLAQPDANQLRLVAQTLAGRALTPEPGQEVYPERSRREVRNARTQEQRAIDSLLSSWKRVVEDNLFTHSK